MSRAAPVALACLVLGVVAPALELASCTVAEPDPPAVCASPLDCELREACIDGQCVSSISDGGEGEGEGELDERAIIDAVCVRLAQCQGGAPVDCSNQLQVQLDDMRRIGSPVCIEAAGSLLEFFQCAAGLSCDQILNDPATGCPVIIQAQQQQNQCFGSEGEGEGE